MNNSSNDVTELTIKNLFNGTDHYLIPPYQRNYAWREPEISQLIQDIIDSSKLSDKQYYIGTLVTYHRNDGKYEVIDGQQRLTTLSLLMMVLLRNDEIDQDTAAKSNILNQLESWTGLCRITSKLSFILARNIS